MSERDFIRTTLTAPSSSCRVDLLGIGDDHPNGSAVYLLIDGERRDSFDARSAGYGYAPCGEAYRTVHVVSRWRCGEVRGYVWCGHVARVRGEKMEWPELDELVARALGARVERRWVVSERTDLDATGRP